MSLEELDHLFAFLSDGHERYRRTVGPLRLRGHTLGWLVNLFDDSSNADPDTVKLPVQVGN